MKTRKQVLAMFRKMQDQFFVERELRGFAEVEGYNQTGGYWTVRLKISEFEDGTREMILHDQVEWTHWRETSQPEQDELDNLQAVEEFKKKYGLK